MGRKGDKVVAYFYDEEIGNFCYGGGNPMRPHRARLTHSLVKNYGLCKQLRMHRPLPRSFTQLTEFHADEYIQFLQSVTPKNQDEYLAQLRRFNMGAPGEADCPVFYGLFEYCQVYSGGSVDGASLLLDSSADISINWSGGMHHAKKAEASGFCYVNDIVLAILELLKVHARVLYVDIDIHHGDGVEEAFYLTDRVMTVSFHKYGDFFPGTGALEDIGAQLGRHYTVNVPLREGMDDESYRSLFEPIMQKVMEMYQPGAIVVCGGADSLSGDRLGCFNLSLQGHSNCVEFLARFNVPMMVLGGGGYTMRNVARCWTYETGRLMGVDLPDNLPEAALSEYNYYLDTQRLRIVASNMKNANTREELEYIKKRVLENLGALPPVPSVQMAYRPPLHTMPDLPDEEMDVRGGGQAYEDVRRLREGDEDSDEEEEGAAVRGRPERVAASPAPRAGAEEGPSKHIRTRKEDELPGSTPTKRHVTLTRDATPTRSAPSLPTRPQTPPIGAAPSPARPASQAGGAPTAAANVGPSDRQETAADGAAAAASSPQGHTLRAKSPAPKTPLGLAAEDMGLGVLGAEGTVRISPDSKRSRVEGMAVDPSPSKQHTSEPPVLSASHMPPEDAAAAKTSPDASGSGPREPAGPSAEQDGTTPLSVACLNRHMEVAALLLDQGAQLDKLDNLDLACLAWIEAAGEVDKRMASLAELARCKLQPARCKKLGVSPEIFQLAKESSKKIKPDVDRLCNASIDGNLQIVLEELLAGTDVDSFNKDGHTPLYWASCRGQEGVAGLLLEFGANVDQAETVTGWTPLMAASFRGRKGVVELLLKNGAQLGKRNKAGSTALYLASINGNKAVEALLRERGARA